MYPRAPLMPLLSDATYACSESRVSAWLAAHAVDAGLASGAGLEAVSAVLGVSLRIDADAAVVGSLRWARAIACAINTIATVTGIAARATVVVVVPQEDADTAAKVVRKVRPVVGFLRRTDGRSGRWRWRWGRSGRWRVAGAIRTAAVVAIRAVAVGVAVGRGGGIRFFFFFFFAGASSCAARITAPPRVSPLSRLASPRRESRAGKERRRRSN